MMRAFLFIMALCLATPVLAQQQPRPPQVPNIETAQDWYRVVSARLQRVGARLVATAARDDGIAGMFEPHVGFTVAFDGSVSDIHIVESSDNEAVDQLALRLPSMAAPFPRFAPDMTRDPKPMVAPLQLHFDPPAAVAEEAEAPATAAASQFIACDNGLRCVREPCANRDTVLLPSGERLENVSPAVDGLSEADQARLQEADGLYDGTVVLEGSVDGGTVVATRIARDATEAEAALCKRPAEAE